MQEGLYHVFTALGNALLSSVWQMGIIWLLIAVYIYLRPATSEAAGSLLRFIGLLAGFILFLITFFTSLNSPQTESGLLKWMTRQDWVRPLLNYSAILYLALLILPLRTILKNSLQLRQLRKDGIGRVPGALKIFMLDAAGYLNIKRKVQLYISSLISSPLTIGFLKPVILLPVAIINQLTPQQLEAIILHELAHIKRNDYLINLITQIILTFLYFNPFARMLVKAQELDREKSADRWVLRFEYGQYMYATTLLQLARGRSAANGFAMQVSGKENQLSYRVAAIMGAPAKRTHSLKKTGLLACLLLLSSGLYLIRNTRPHPQTNPIAFEPAVQLQAPAMEVRYSTTIPGIEKVADTDQEQYSVRPIPAIEKPDAQPGDHIVYLKIHETPEGKIQAPTPPQPPAAPAAPAIAPMILFADHPTVIVPDLDSAAEERVQQSMDAFKKLVAELTWKHLENNLAETVTEDQKNALKGKLSQLLGQMNWEQNANLLRSFYNDINWQQTDDQLKASLNALFQIKAARYNTSKQKEAADYRRLADSIFNQAKSMHKQTDSLYQRPSASKVSSATPAKVIDL